jgi:3-oxoacid CoA-transferase
MFRGTSRNFNPEVATAAKFTIAEVEEIVPVGSLKPEDIHLPGAFDLSSSVPARFTAFSPSSFLFSGIYVHSLYKASMEKKIERLTLAKSGTGMKKADKRERIVRRGLSHVFACFYLDFYHFLSVLFACCSR